MIARTTPLIALCFGIASFPASAHEIPVNTVQGLVKNCTLEDQSQAEVEHHAGLCIGFIKGVTNALAMHKMLKVCVPEGLENGDLIEAVLTRAKALPGDMQDLPSAALVQLSLENAFPCAQP